MILGRNQPKDGAGKGSGNRKEDRKAAAQAREKAQALRKAVSTAESEVARLTRERTAVEHAMFDPAGAEPKLGKLAMGDLMKMSAQLNAAIAAAEAKWLEASDALEAIA